MTEPGPAEPVVRPLPQPSISSEPFWASGADGRLRIAQCQACRRYHHPPVPICPECRSLEVAMTPVSGRATVVGFTVNQHQWLPGLRAAVRHRQRRPRRGSADVRLTTNIVGCEPGEVAIGQQVRGPVRAARGRVAPAVRARPASSTTGPIPGPRDLARPCGRRCPQRPLRAQVGAVRRRPLGDRPAADGRPAVADRRRVPARPSPTPA